MIKDRKGDSLLFQKGISESPESSESWSCDLGLSFFPGQYAFIIKKIRVPIKPKNMKVNIHETMIHLSFLASSFLLAFLSLFFFRLVVECFFLVIIQDKKEGPGSYMRRSLLTRPQAYEILGQPKPRVVFNPV